jgi:hypothetical protein
MTTAWESYHRDGTTQYEDREESANVSSLRDKYGDGNPPITLDAEELAAYIIELETAVKLIDDQLLSPVLKRLYDYPTTEQTDHLLEEAQQKGTAATILMHDKLRRLEARRQALRALVNAAGELVDSARNARPPAALHEDGSLLPPTFEDLYPNHRRENQ